MHRHHQKHKLFENLRESADRQNPRKKMKLVLPELSWEDSIPYYAPPPSPIVPNRQGPSFTNADLIAQFLQNSHKVPNLVLPDHIADPRSSVSALKIDLQSLESLENSSAATAALVSVVSGIGCFQVINHGISADLIRSAAAASAGLFRVPSPPVEKGFGEEEFVWCKDRGLELIWPFGYSNFKEKMELLSRGVEEVARKIMAAVRGSGGGPQKEARHGGAAMMSYVYKHGPNVSRQMWLRSLRHDIMRMVMEGVDFSHALCLHLCDGPSEFVLPSEKGWVSFFPDPDAIVVTAGDQVQTWGGGKYKHVVGRPICNGGVDMGSVCMAFLCHPSITEGITQETTNHHQKTITIAQQAKLALLLLVAAHIYSYLC